MLLKARALVDPELRAAVGSLPAPARNVAAYHFGWRDERGRPSSGGVGKFLRPALVLLACEGVGGRPEQALRAAVTVELVHNMSLIHDDVIDRDALRRHRPTVWSVFGLPAAILTGDALLSLAGRILADAPGHAGMTGRAWLDDAVQELIAGEFADSTAENREAVTLQESVATAEAKTGSLIALSCALGALAGGADEARVGHLRSFGRHLGAAFQLTDDILGIWGDPQITGKPYLSDLRSRKKSLPVVAALAAPGQAARELAGLYHSPAVLTDAELMRVAELVEAAGGRAWAECEAGRRLTEAIAGLEAADLTRTAYDDLSALTLMITGRDH